jgi:hypothetical protein
LPPPYQAFLCPIAGSLGEGFEKLGKEKNIVVWDVMAA